MWIISLIIFILAAIVTTIICILNAHKEEIWESIEFEELER
jgi:ABC-type antimicrobial peptide transport system permease subunit